MCAAADIYGCHNCGTTFQSKTDPDGCPDCASRDLVTERCIDCPARKLEEAMAGPLGGVLQRSMQIETALQLGFSHPLSETTCEEFAAVTFIREERLRREVEEARKNQ